MATMGLLLLLLLLASSPLQPAALPHEGILDTVATGTMILSSMENATDFLESGTGNHTLASVVGFPMLEAQLRDVQELWAKDPLLEPLSQRVESLYLKLLNVRITSLFNLMRKDPDRLQVFMETLRPGFWKLPHAWTHTRALTEFHKKAFVRPPRALNHNRASIGHRTSRCPNSASKDLTLQCLAQMLESRSTSSSSCAYSPSCMAHVTMPGCVGSHLSNQVLYFLLSKMVGCTEGFFKQTEHYMDLFCSTMMDTNRKHEATGYSDKRRDLFVKNIILCGAGGYADFYKLAWLKAILSWQKPRTGCFSMSRSCDEHFTNLVIGALGSYLYVLAEFPQIYELPVEASFYTDGTN